MKSATLLLSLAWIAFGCAGCATGAKTEPAPCDPASYAVLAATCGDDAAVCEQKISERQDFCAKAIKESK
jgi:hypothetical protein